MRCINCVLLVFDHQTVLLTDFGVGIQFIVDDVALLWHFCEFVLVDQERTGFSVVVYEDCFFIIDSVVVVAVPTVAAMKN